MASQRKPALSPMAIGGALLVAACGAPRPAPKPPEPACVEESHEPLPFGSTAEQEAEDAAAAKRSAALATEAKTAYARGDAERAYQLFLEADKVWSSWEVQANLGAVALEREHWLVAAKNLKAADEAFFMLPRSSATAAALADVKRRLEVAMQHVGTLHVVATPAWARIFVDGAFAGRAPQYDILVEPGEHEVELRFRCYEDLVQKVWLGAGAARTVKLEMARAAPTVTTPPEEP
jgi:PEGA domain-containing protein